jgi:hypothetical protein
VRFRHGYSVGMPLKQTLGVDRVAATIDSPKINKTAHRSSALQHLSRLPRLVVHPLHCAGSEYSVISWPQSFRTSAGQGHAIPAGRAFCRTPGLSIGSRSCRFARFAAV